jgi:hypothetical protein
LNSWIASEMWRRCLDCLVNVSVTMDGICGFMESGGVVSENRPCMGDGDGVV